jgi:RNA 2',3'-cyclic 3'-phosphodiesterase
MPQTIRTFIAVEMDAQIRRGAQRLVDKFRATGAGVSWGAPENMHLTLKFLGDVSVDDVTHVCQAVREAVSDVAPFSLQIRGAGAFPDLRRPRVFWLGAGDGQQAMATLAERIESALSDLGFAREGRPFQSHLTLGRVRRGGAEMAALARLVEQNAAVDLGQTPIDEVVVFSSELKPTGAVYAALDRVRLGSR